MSNLISIIVPCYNEEKALPYFFSEIQKVTKKMSDSYSLCFEFLLKHAKMRRNGGNIHE